MDQDSAYYHGASVQVCVRCDHPLWREYQGTIGRIVDRSDDGGFLVELGGAVRKRSSHWLRASQIKPYHPSDLTAFLAD